MWQEIKTPITIKFLLGIPHSFKGIIDCMQVSLWKSVSSDTQRTPISITQRCRKLFQKYVYKEKSRSREYRKAGYSGMRSQSGKALFWVPAVSCEAGTKVVGVELPVPPLLRTNHKGMFLTNASVVVLGVLRQGFTQPRQASNSVDRQRGLWAPDALVGMSPVLGSQVHPRFFPKCPQRGLSK